MRSPTLHGRHLRGVVALSFLLGTLSAQTLSSAPDEVLAALDLRAGTIQSLGAVAHDDAARVDLVLGGRHRTLLLTPHDVRPPHFRLLVDDGEEIREVPRPPSVTWRGTLVGEPGSRVAASIVDGRLRAQIHGVSSTDRWGVQPLREVRAGAPSEAHVVYAMADVVSRGGKCGLDAPPRRDRPRAGGGPRRPESMHFAELACDCDVDFYQRNGSSVTTTQNDVTSIVNAMDVIFQRDVGIQYLLGTILVRTVSGIYTTNDPNGLLSEFSREWNANQTTVPRDLAHLFTGRNLSGSVIGIASLGSVCNRTGAYGLSQSRFSNNMTSRVALTAHECGHNFSAPHCNGSSGCAIMCASLGGCGSVGNFGPDASAQIISFRRIAPCLGVPGPPTLTSVTPTTLEAFEVGDLIVLRGDNLAETLTISLGGATVTRSGMRRLTRNQIDFAAPEPAAVGPTTLVATNYVGSSAPLPFRFDATIPPRARAALFVGAGFDAPVFHGGQPGNSWFMLLAVDAYTTFPFLGWQVLGNPLTLASGVYGPSGLNDYRLPLPATTPPSTQLTFQVAEIGPGFSTFEGVSPLTFSFVLQ